MSYELWVMKTADQIFQETQDDLSGRNGELAREGMLLGLARLALEQKTDLTRVYGRDGVQVMHAGETVLFSTRR